MTNPKQQTKHKTGDSSASRPGSPQSPRRRLLRSPDERMLAGVAGGTAQYLGIDPTFVRLGFAAAVLFGGFGLLAYLVMAVVVPEDDGSGAPVTGAHPPAWAIVLLALAALAILPGPFLGWGDGFWFLGFGGFWIVALVVVGALAYRAWRGEWPGQGGGTSDQAPAGKPAKASAGAKGPGGKGAVSQGAAEADTAVMAKGDGTGQRLVRLLAIGLLGLCSLCAAITVGALGAFAAATGSGEVVAGIVVALGIALVGMALIGDGFRRSAPWLLGLALILALPAGAVAAADIRFDGGIGEQTHTPVSVADIPEDGYELGVGQMKVDLRQLDLAAEQVVELPAKVGLGQLVISVPPDVCVTGRAEAKGGELLVRGVSNAGASPEFERGAAPDARLPSIDLDVELQFGQLVVTDRDPQDYDRREQESYELAPLPEACLG